MEMKSAAGEINRVAQAAQQAVGFDVERLDDLRMICQCGNSLHGLLGATESLLRTLSRSVTSLYKEPGLTYEATCEGAATSLDPGQAAEKGGQCIHEAASAVGRAVKLMEDAGPIVTKLRLPTP